LSSSSLSKPCISERQSGSAVSTNQITADLSKKKTAAKTSCLTSSKHVKLFSQAYHSMTKNVYRCFSKKKKKNMYRLHGIATTLHIWMAITKHHTPHSIWYDRFVRCSMQLHRGNR
jgi:predicted AAA+ superfamily ATPase